MRLPIIPNWRDGWKMLSVQIIFAGLALEGAFAAFPETVSHLLSDHDRHWVGRFILLGAFLGRFKDQRKPQKDEDHGQHSDY